jgi:hypothetical protein
MLGVLDFTGFIVDPASFVQIIEGLNSLEGQFSHVEIDEVIKRHEPIFLTWST